MRSATTIWLSIFILFNILIEIRSQQNYDSGNQPLNSPIQMPEEQSKIVQYHNSFRSKVVPPASNMLEMSWSPLAAQQAQKDAEKCDFSYRYDPTQNTVPDLGICGQNIFIASDQTPWSFAINSWFSQNQNFTYGSPNNNLEAIGSYTQMVWSTSHEVGCGVARCSGGPWGQFYIYICNYCPGGNFEGMLQYPYKTGQPCGDCPGYCGGDSLCTNSCPFSNYYGNCDSLVKSDQGFCKQETCKATCTCGSERLYKNYPW